METSLNDRGTAVARVAAAVEVYLNEGKLELPVMPHVAQKVMSLANDPEADASDLSNILNQDQAIAGHVVRVANSANYAGGQSIDSLDQAVARVGMNLLGEIAIAISVKNELFDIPGFEAEAKMVSRHALATAIYGKEVARKRRRNAESQFLCGLLHSIGEPIALDLISQTMDFVCIDLDREDVRSIMKALGPQIASRAVKEWQLPRLLQATTKFNRDYDRASVFQDGCIATYVSRILADWLLYPNQYDASELKDDPAFGLLNLYPDDVQDLLDKRDEVQSVVGAMEL